MFTHQITEAFVEGKLDLALRRNPPQAGWAALPEVIAADQVRAAGGDDVAVRLFCTFTSAMERARESTRLWNRAAKLFQQLHTRWIFRPREIVARPIAELREILKTHGVSQKHTEDIDAWRRIGESLSRPDRAPFVYRAIYNGHGDADALLRAVEDRIDQQWLFPLLKGPKISQMWIRMLVVPGGANIVNLQALRVAVDTQVHRVTYYLRLTDIEPRPGRIRQGLRSNIQEAWQTDIRNDGAAAPSDCQALANTAGALDPALWFVGKWGCSFCWQHGEKVPIAEFCSNCRLSGSALNGGPKTGRLREDLTLNSNRGTEQDGALPLSPLAREHYKIAHILNSEHPGRPFTALQFKGRYRESFPNRNVTSIMPADYSIPSGPSVSQRPKFLRKTDGGYVFMPLSVEREF